MGNVEKLLPNLNNKILRNSRNRVDIRLISSDKVTNKLAAKPNYVRFTIFDENLIAAHMKRIKLYLNNPVYLGMGILDLSKSLMYAFITTILRLNMGIMQNFSSPTQTLPHMKLRPKIFTKISTPTLRKNGLTQVTIQIIIHLKLKQDDLIEKYVECFRMKLAGSRLLNLLACVALF